jgi:hypothetical protein
MIYRPMHLLGHLNRIDKSNSALQAGFPTFRISECHLDIALFCGHLSAPYYILLFNPF